MNNNKKYISMKKILNNRISHLLLLSIMLIMTIMTSCNNDDLSGGAPVITEVRNYEAAPNDTLVTSIVPGQWIVIHGHNLKDAVEISFNGVSADFNTGIFRDDAVVLQVPPSIPFNDIDPEMLNTIKYVTSEGVTTFRFDLNSLPVTITGNSMTASKEVGDSIFISGTNLFLIKELKIGGVDISSFKTVSDGSSIGFVLPVINAPMPWEGEIVAQSGTYQFNILIVPEIFAVSNANPSEGDIVRVYGKNLGGVTSFKFGGATITEFSEDPEGFYVEFTAPGESNYAYGPVSIVNTFGTVTTPYNVNTRSGYTEGLLANLEWGSYFGWAWWRDASLTVDNVANNGGWMKVMSDINGAKGSNHTMFVSFDTPALKAGEDKLCAFGNGQWMPTANLSDPVGNWALQFEISVAKPWNGSTLYIKTGFAGETYVARFEPWKISATRTADFKTDGWQTVTIPLSQFKSKEDNVGDGDSISSITSILGATGNTGFDIILQNFGTSDTKTGFYAGIDNIRVVKIKE